MAHAIDPRIGESVIRRATEERLARFNVLLANVPDESLLVLEGLRQRGIRTALITNADVIETNGWSDSPLDGAFDEVIFSWQVGLAKPDPAVYRHCLDHLGVEPRRAIFVGDGGSHELDGAKRFGMTAVFTRQFLPISDEKEIARRHATADYTIGSLSELLA